MKHVVVLFALASIVGCTNEHEYMSPTQFEGSMLPTSGSALLRGDVGEILSIDNRADSLWVSKDADAVEFSGDVPHQLQSGSSVFIDVRIANFEQLAVGQELRQEGTVDIWAAEATDGPLLDVYICPNGEGLSGNADDIVVTKTGPESYTFQATSTVPEQNLDIDLDLVAAE